MKNFIDDINKILKARPKSSEVKENNDDTTVAKMFEEVKILVRDLPMRVDGQLREEGLLRKHRRRRRLHPRALEELIFNTISLERRVPSTIGLMMFASFVKDDFPWFFEMAVDYHRAYLSGNEARMAKTREFLIGSIDMAMHSKLMMEMGGPEDEETFYFMRQALKQIERILPAAPTATQRKTAEKESHKEKTSSD